MNDAAVRVRTARNHDASAIAALILPIQQQEFALPITLGDQPDLRDIESHYRRANGNFWVAEIDDRIVGSIALLDIGAGQAALRKMFVAAAYRGARFGVAAALLHVLLDWAERCGMREIFLGTAAEFLAAHRFYEKHGFSEIAKQTLPASFPVMAVDTKFYRWMR